MDDRHEQSLLLSVKKLFEGLALFGHGFAVQLRCFDDEAGASLGETHHTVHLALWNASLTGYKQRVIVVYLLDDLRTQTRLFNQIDSRSKLSQLLESGDLANKLYEKK